MPDNENPYMHIEIEDGELSLSGKMDGNQQLAAAGALLTHVQSGTGIGWGTLLIEMAKEIGNAELALALQDAFIAIDD